MLIAAWFLAALALVILAGLGLGSFFNPRWGARLVRLRDDPERPGGFAEFRATYGGVFFGTHAAALLLTFLHLTRGDPVWGVYAGGAVLALGAGMAGSAIGRTLSMWRDGTGTRFNQGSALFEAAMALMLWAPWLAGLFL